MANPTEIRAFRISALGFLMISVLGIVFAILAWLALAARLIVYASTFNVIRHEQRHGTVTVEIRVPRMAGEVPLSATRGGAVEEVSDVTDGRDASDVSGDGGPPEEPPARRA